MDTALAIRPTAGLPSTQEWKTLLEMADAFVKSGLLPDAIKTPQAAVLVMQKGRELGIPPLYALSNIVVIKGKPAANAELMLAIIYRDHGDDAMRFTKTDNTGCTISYKRRNWTERQTYSFTVQDAQTAGLTAKETSSTWKQYPAAMCRARCISAVARMAFPDSLGGLYTPEELGATVTVNESGETEVKALPSVDVATGEIIEQPPEPPRERPHADEPVPICADCTLPIPAAKWGGKDHEPYEVAAMTNAKYGDFLCIACAKKRVPAA